MGIPFFPTLVYDYLIWSIDNLKQINLANQNVIIDGNSFMHFIYNEIVKEDKRKQILQRLTGTPFGYDGCWKRFHETLSLFKEKCSNVIVVFDGIVKSNSYRRPEPNRLYSSRISTDEEQKPIPTLLRHEFLHILRELEIRIIVAPGEADQLIVMIAEKQNVYIVSDDSDYHLYQLSQGFVPFRYLNLKTLTGPSFQLADIFGRIGVTGAALWATLIENIFVRFEKLQESCPIKFVPDKRNFHQWLENTHADVDKRQWTTNQLCVLRFIQKVGTTDAYNKLINCVSQIDRSHFNQIMNSYTNIQQKISLSTRIGNYPSPIIENRFINGELDRKLIEILINRDLPISWQDLSSVHFHLLLPMCYIFLKSGYQNAETTDLNPTITNKGQQYNLFEMFKNEDLPSLNDVSNLSKNDQQKYVLYCIRFPLQVCWDEVNEDYTLWLSLLKLWFHAQENRTPFTKPVLVALIISFLKHVLLDTYDEDERDVPDKDLSFPLLQYSPQELKNQFSLEVCAFLREKIGQYSTKIILPNEHITTALHEVEQLYDSLVMINQFFGYSLPMPTPHKCMSQLTYRLAVVFSNSKNISLDISHRLFDEYTLLTDMTEEILAFIYNSS